MLARRGRWLAKLPLKITSVAGRVRDTSTVPPLLNKNLSSLFVAWELMDLVNHRGFLAAQRLRMDTALTSRTTTAMERDRTAGSVLQDALSCPGGTSVCTAGSRSFPW